MLVLTRRNNEELAIPSLGVTLKIIETHSNRVRIGIDAPVELSVRRAELPTGKPGLKATSDPAHD